MTSDSEKAEAVEQLLDTPDLATALESEPFKKFLDQAPIAIAVSDLNLKERVVYANPEFYKVRRPLPIPPAHLPPWLRIGYKFRTVRLFAHVELSCGSKLGSANPFAGSARPEPISQASAITPKANAIPAVHNTYR
jgi:hypothetical protein